MNANGGAPVVNITCNCNCAPDNHNVEAWKRAFELHESNFVHLETNRWASLEWIFGLFGRPTSRLASSLGVRYGASIAELQRMHLRYLQIRLMDISVSLQFDGETEIVAHERDLGNLLRQYTQGVQDYEYMIKVSQQPYDFFVMSAQRIQDRRLLDGAMASRSKSPSDLEPDGIMATGPWEVSKLRKDIELAAAAVAVAPAGNGVPAAPPAQGLPEQLTEPIGGTRPDRLKSLLQRAFWLRVGESVVGGAFVIGPMWLLALKQDLIFQLGATTICVAGFGTILAWYSDAPGQVFAATLAYAAILMVFVGVMVDNS